MTRKERKLRAHQRRIKWMEIWIAAIAAFAQAQPKSTLPKLLEEKERAAVKMFERPDWEDDLRRTWREFTKMLLAHVAPTQPPFHEENAAHTFTIKARAMLAEHLTQPQ